MPRGAPDWYMYRRGLGQDAMPDLLEQAARLGSIVLHDRRGDVIYLDDFSSGANHWFASSAHPASTALLSAATARHGNLSIELHAALIADTHAALSARFPYPDPTRLGLECAFTVDVLSDHIVFSLYVYDGTYENYGRVQYHPHNTTLDILLPAAGIHVITNTLDLNPDDHHFHILKLVIDTTTRHYTRLIIDDTEWDLTPYPFSLPLDNTPNRQAIEFHNYGNDTDESDIYIDDVILTYNEPTNA